MTPVVHLVTGQTGAGKTSYARWLAEHEPALRYSIDDWMTRLFWMDSPAPIVFAWTMERIDRCETMIREQLAAVLGLGVSVVLDLGFTRRAHRRLFAEHAARLGAVPRLHWVDVHVDERWARVQQRNLERGDTYAMQVDRAMFDFMERQWEAPDSAEAPERVTGIR